MATGGFFGRLASALTQSRTPAKPYAEQGVAGFTSLGGYVVVPEKNPDVQGPNRWHTASDILTNLSVVAAGVRYSLNLISRPKWRADPPSDKPEAKAMAEFVEEVIDNIDTSWSRIVRRSGVYRYHGFNLQEWVAKKRDDGKIGIQSIDPRPVHTITKWDIDANGGVLGVIQVSPQNGQEIYLPRQKLVYLVDDALTDRPDGMGWFRHLADPAQRLRRYLKLETMGFERDLAGIPVGRAPLQRINQLVKDGKLTQEQADSMVKAMEQFVRIQAKEPSTGLLLDSEPFRVKTDTGEQISSVMQWGMELLTGSPVSSAELASAIHRLMYDMAMIIGTEQMLVGNKGEGSRALSEDKSRNLYLTSNAALGDMTEAYDRDIVTTLWTMNGFDEELRPKLTCEDVSFKDAAEIAKALADMAAAGAILHPNDPAINDLRDLMGVSPAPELDQSTADLMLGAKAGLRPPAEDGSGGDGPDKGGRPSRENPQGDGGKPQQDQTQKFNPNHVPSGPDGGQFTTATNVSGPVGLSDYMKQLAGDPSHHPNIEGLKVDGDAIFHPEKSALIRREDMPQIPEGAREAFLTTVPNTVEMANPHQLYPTQDQIDGYKVGLFATDPSIPFQTPIVSSDNYVVDGHHHWASAVVKSVIRGSDAPSIPIHRVGLTRDQLLAQTRAYAQANNFAREPLWKFDPNQPRDYHGRWTSYGAGSIQQLTPKQLEDAFKILRGAHWEKGLPSRIAAAESVGLNELDETLDHAAWERPGDFKPWQSAWTRADRRAAARKYDPNEPRDYHGRWTDGGVGSIGGPAFEKAMAEVIEKGKADGKEHLVGIDSHTGQVIFRNDGKETSVKLDDATAKVLDDPSQAVDVIHNHPPFTDDPGFDENMISPLSPQDVSTLASGEGERSVTAVAHEGSWFTASRPSKPDALSNLRGVFGEDRFGDSVIMAKYATAGRFLSAAADEGKVTMQEAQLLHFHALWTAADNAGVINYSYHLTPLGQKIISDHQVLFDALVRKLG